MRVAVANAASAVVCDPPLTCFPYVPQDGPTPFLYVQVEGVAYDKAMARGMDEIVLSLMVMVSTADDISGQRFVDALLSGSGSASLKAAIDAARGAPGEHALDGAADDIHLIGTESPPRWYEWRDGVKYYGVGLKALVIGSGS